MTEAGGEHDPEPDKSLHERGLLALAQHYRTTQPCSPCVGFKRWRLLSPMERTRMGVTGPGGPGGEEPHTCQDRDLEFWLEVSDGPIEEAEPPPREFSGWAVDKGISPRIETERAKAKRERRLRRL